MPKFLLLFFCVHLSCFAESAVTYELSGDRFSDQLQGYLHAKWVSYCTGLPLLYKPFAHSVDLALDDFETLFTEEIEGSFSEIKRLTGWEWIVDSTLYVVPLYSECADDQVCFKDKLVDIDWEDEKFVVDWRDEGFRSLLRKAFIPKRKIKKPSFPQEGGCLTVAVHLRKGGGIDPENAYTVWPLRFPPDYYYIESLRTICSLFPGRSVYAYLFTDDLHPQEIMKKYAEALSDLPIQLDCRKHGNHPCANILDDCLAMADFDCLIRSQSNYTLIPFAIGTHQVVIVPKHYIWILEGNPKVVVNHIDQKEIFITRNLAARAQELGLSVRF